MIDSLNQVSGGLKGLDELFSTVMSVHTAIGHGHVVVHATGRVHDHDVGQAMPQPHVKVVGVMCGRDFDSARTKRWVNMTIGNDGNQPVGFGGLCC